MTEALPRVLLIEDDRELQGLLARLLARRFSVLTTDSSIDALAILDLGLPFVAILCDLRLERLSGIDLYAKVLRLGGPAERFIFMTGSDGTELRRAIASVGKGRVLLKPFGRAALFDCIAGLAIPGRT